MGFEDAVRSVLSKYVGFQGRALRSEYWWWILFVIILTAVTNAIDGFVIAPLLGFQSFEMNAGQPLSIIVSLAFFLPSLAVSIRRLHDIGRSGWWILIGLIPLIGMIVLIYWYVQPSQDGDNQFGQAAG